MTSASLGVCSINVSMEPCAEQGLTLISQLRTLRGSLVEDVWKLEEVMGWTFRKAPMAPRNPSCLKNRAAISPCVYSQTKAAC